MTYSGIVADPNAGLSPRGSYPVRLTVFTALAGAMGWALTVHVPQLPDFAWQVAVGFAMAIGLVLLMKRVSQTRGERMFAALCMAAAFTAGMWGPWANAQFGGIPTLDQLRASGAGVTYDLLAFGEPFKVSGYIFEMWVAVTVLMVSFPLIASLAKPQPAGTRHNPFNVHSDFADPFIARLVFFPFISFMIAALAVYLNPYAVAYEVPLQLVWVPPLAAGFLYAKLHMTFPKALLVSLAGGIAGAAGFWLPWLYMTSGQDGMMAFISSSPQDMLARAQELAAGYSYVTEFAGTITDYSPWAFEIWMGLTLTYLCLPLLVTLLRRFLSFARAT